MQVRPKETARRLLSKAAAAADAGRGDQRALDQAVTAALRAVPVENVRDAPAMAGFLYGAFSPLAYATEVLRHPQGSDADALRWRTLLRVLATAVPPVPVASALRIGLAQDRLLVDATPFVRSRWVADVGLHARLSSSSVATGRLLQLLVRLRRPAEVVEVGTAYGIGSLYIAEALREAGEGRLRTLEISQPQVEVAGRVLAEQTDVVDLRSGDPSTLLAETLVAGSGVQFVFHDGEHSGDAYERDFLTLVDHMDPGAMFLLDDLRWNDPQFGERDPQTYRGWQAITAHPRVRAAAELGSAQGLVMV